MPRGPRLLVLLLPLLAGLTIPPRVQADGGYVSPFGRDVLEPSQIGFIQFDESARTERLIILPSFRSYTTDFAWIVPVPALPEIDTAETALFVECSELTRPLPEQVSRGSCSNFDLLTGVGPPSGGVAVYDERQVGIYRTLTIGASDTAVLTDSLDTWGYLHTDNRDEVEAALQFYVDRSWYFVAMKVDSTRFSDRDGENTPWLGLIDPVCFTFAAEEIVYPMRLSAISADYHTSVLLYVCADHRVTFEAASTEYAHRLSTGELLLIRKQYKHLGALIPRPCFLTKLRRHFVPEDMTEDVILTWADSDQEYRSTTRYYGDVSLGGGLLVAMLACVMRARRRRS